MKLAEIPAEQPIDVATQVLDLRNVSCDACAIDREPNGNVHVFGSYQCYDASRKHNILITPEILSPRSLCECSPGHYRPKGGTALDCSVCAKKSYAPRSGATGCIQCAFYEKTDGVKPCRVPDGTEGPFFTWHYQDPAQAFAT